MIELVVLDVDGCLSDGKLTYTDDGVEFKNFNVKDGLGIVSWLKLGKKVAIITGKSSSMVAKRAKELKIDYVFQGIKDKLSILDEILQKEGLSYENVAAIGDDLNDLKMLRCVGYSFSPKDAHELIKSEVDTVLEKKGGDGAVRQMIDLLVKKQNLNEEFLKLWL